MPLTRAQVDPGKFNPAAELPYQLRIADFEMAMRDVYDFFFDVNSLLAGRGLTVILSPPPSAHPSAESADRIHRIDRIWFSGVQAADGPREAPPSR